MKSPVGEVWRFELPMKYSRLSCVIYGFWKLTPPTEQCCLFFMAAWFPMGPAELVAFYRIPDLRLPRKLVLDVRPLRNRGRGRGDRTGQNCRDFKQTRCMWNAWRERSVAAVAAVEREISFSSFNNVSNVLLQQVIFGRLVVYSFIILLLFFIF